MANLTVGYDAAETAKTYTTVAAAFAAASNGDNLQIFYSDANKNRFWTDVNIADSTTKVVSIEGMLPDRQVVFTHKESQLFWYYMNGDLSGQASQVTIQNICIFAFEASIEECIRYNDSSGSGGGIRVTNCFITGFRTSVFFAGAANNVCQVDNCFIGWSSKGIDVSIPSYIYYNTVIACTNGIDASNSASTITNCVSLWNRTADYLAVGSATITYCCDSDGTLPVAAGNITRSDQDDLDFWSDAMADISGGQRGLMIDPRIVVTSDLYAAGLAVAGVPTDCDGNTRANPPSMGWHEGTERAYNYPVPSAGNVPVCFGALDAQPWSQGSLLVRFYEMFPGAGTVPYRYDFHVKRLDSGILTKADIDADTYFQCAFYNDVVTGNDPGSPLPDPTLLAVVLTLESAGDIGDNIHLMTNRQYQIAVRAVAIDSGDRILEDDNDEVILSWSSGYQGLTHQTIIDWPCLDLCAGAEVGIASLPPVIVDSLPTVNVAVTSLPSIEMAIAKMPNLNVNIDMRGRGRG